MIRVVALRKAIVAGLSGAAVMELFSLATAAAGLPTVDLVAELSTSEFHRLPVVAEVAALIAHLSIGVCWAVFYAFFFWGRLRIRPPLQGLVFAALPATLAIVVVYPELALMRLPTDTHMLDVRTFFAPLTAPTVASLLVSHALFGLTVGAIYRRPVGYPADRKADLPVRRSAGASAPKRNENRTG